MRLIPQGIRGNCHGTGEKTGRVMFASARIRFHIGTAVFRLVHSSSQLYNGDLWFRNPSASPPKHTSRTQTLPPLRSLYRRRTGHTSRTQTLSPLRSLYRRRTGSVRGPASPPLLPQAAGRRVRHDVSLIVVLLDVNPFFWASSAAAAGDSASSHHPTTTLAFSKLLNHVIPLLNSLLLLNQLNQVVLVATGVNSCGYIYDSGNGEGGSTGGSVPAICSEILRRLEEFVVKDRLQGKGPDKVVASGVSSLLSGSLSLALCCIL
ncbi:hypothetical protein BHM03_00000458 [Ensete ventricosum]|nr:hypothetical protein BHM03_00000458 [Ensete ventricosum]